MRTTITLDAGSEQIVRRRMQEHGVSFKTAVNDLIKAGATTGAKPFRTPTKAMGRPRVNLDRALQLAAEIEDQELVAKMRRGS